MKTEQFVGYVCKPKPPLKPPREAKERKLSQRELFVLPKKASKNTKKGK